MAKGKAKQVEPEVEPDLDETPVETEPVEESQPAAQVQSPQHPDFLIRRARLLGVPEATIAAASSEELDQIAFNEQRKFLLMERQQHLEREPAPKQTETINDFDHEIEETAQRIGMEPEFKELFKKQSKRLRELETQHSAKLKEIEERDQRRQQSTLEESLDDAFASLPDQYKTVFGGDASARDLPEQSREMRLRVRFFQSAGINPQADSPTSIRRKIHAAVKDIYGELPAEKPKGNPYEKKAPVKKLTQEEWKEGTLAEPTSRTSEPPRGDAAVRDSVHKFFQKLRAEEAGAS